MSSTVDCENGTPSVDDLAHRAVAMPPSVETVRLLNQIETSALSHDGRLSFLQATERAQAWLSSLSTQPITELVDSALQADEERDEESRELARSSSREEMRVVLSLSSPAARNRIDVAEQLQGNLSLVQEALAIGEITYGHARTIVDEVAHLDPDIAQTVIERVLPRSVGKPLSTLRRQLRLALAALDTEQIVERHEQEASRRSISRWNTDNGMAELSVTAPAPDVQLIWQALTILAGTDESAATFDDPRPIGARRVDALTRLCIESVAPSARGEGAPVACGPSASSDGGRAPRRPRIPTQAQIVIDLPTLVGLADNPAELRGHGPVPADVARCWLADAESWQRLVVDPADDHLMDLGPVVQRPPPGLDAFVRARDGTCTFPFCNHPAHRCDLDHCDPHRSDGSGGDTSAQNLGALCRYHHRIKTFMGWVPRVQPDRSVVWESPSGRTYHVAVRSQCA